MKLAFIIDPITKLDPTHDSSVAVMEATEKLAAIDGHAAAYLQTIQIEA
jgi:glutathione synthase